MVGSGPAGSVAALVLARGGAKVALVDKAEFPRDKACGDLVGPRGVQLLADLGLTDLGPTDLGPTDLGLEPAGGPRTRTVSSLYPYGIQTCHSSQSEPSSSQTGRNPHEGVGEMVVLGPTGGRALLRARAGTTYPGQGWATPRRSFDDWLRRAALDAGAEPVHARAAGVSHHGVALDDDRLILADAIIGADGANSAVATSAGLVDPTRVLWGFAIRAYLDQRVELPVISFWDPTPGRGFPGYGWIFPLPGGRANAGLGVGAGADRRRGAQATRQLDAFLAHLTSAGLISETALAGHGHGNGQRHGHDNGHGQRTERLGGWLKMGMVGTTPAAGRVLLVGDAVGLVNPLQGEGIAEAMASGRAAAEAILTTPATAAATYSMALKRRYLAYHSATAALQQTLIDRPRLVSALGRLLTAPGVGRLVGGGWGIYWNDLLDGAAPGVDRRIASAFSLAMRAATSHGASRRWLSEALARSSELATSSSSELTTSSTAGGLSEPARRGGPGR